MKLVFIQCGKTGVGKTTAELKMKEEYGVEPVEVYTTRDRRLDDPDHYHCVSKGKFNQLLMDKKFTYSFEVANGTYYGFILPDKKYSVISFLSEKDVKGFRDSLPANVFSSSYELIADYNQEEAIEGRGTPVTDLDDRNSKSCSCPVKVHRDGVLLYVRDIISKFAVMTNTTNPHGVNKYVENNIRSK